MENTERVLFEQNEAEWYIAVGDGWVGPMTASDVYQRVVRGEITWAHYVWKQGQAEWKRLCDVKAFQTAVPQTPSRRLKTEIKEASKPVVAAKARKTSRAAKPEPRTWYLYYSDSQYGPFSAEEVSRFLSVGKINERVHAWRKGLAQWTRLQEISEFAQAVGDKKAKGRSGLTGQIEQRQAPRQPMVARIFVAAGQDLMTAICRDISVGGMQVLTDQIPGPVGTRVKLNVSPTTEGAATSRLAPFVAEGVIVRWLEDGRGFSFRFEKLADDARRAIEAYVAI